MFLIIQLVYEKVGKLEYLHPSLDPKRCKEKNMTLNDGNPIVFALDVTGSMGEWSKVIYDKMPMFFGQIKIQKYLNDPCLSFCAVGDVRTDCAPLQVSEFGKGAAIDEQICNLYLEGNGGGNNHESYDISAYFYANKVNLINCDIPFFFLTCDEMYWEECSNNHFERLFGHKIPGELKKIDSKESWKKLLEKYNVFILRKSLPNKNFEPNVQKIWVNTVGEERVLKISNPKAVIDVVLGAISLTSNSRTITEYKIDLINRGQTNERIEEVISVLTPYYESIKNGTAKIIKNQNYISKIDKLDKKTDFPILKEFFLKEILSNQNTVNFNYYKDLLILSKELEGKIPEEIICPLTDNIFCIPVKTSNGKTYEKNAIEYWLKTNRTDPISGEMIDVNLNMDHNITEKVMEFYECSKIYLEL